MSVTRARIVGWTIWIGVCLAPVGYVAYQAHDPVAIAKVKAQHAQEETEAHQATARAGCALDMEAADDGTTAAETVARAIIATCGPAVPRPEGPPCSTDPKCMQALQQISLQVETASVLEVRYKRAQAKANDAKAALERTLSH